jgi:hypothetical protein
VLPFRFYRSAVNSSYSVRGRIGGNPKTSCKTERQRANGHDDQRTLPSALTNATMSQQLHLAVTGTAFARLYILGPNEADITSVTDTPHEVGYRTQGVGCTVGSRARTVVSHLPALPHHHREPSIKSEYLRVSDEETRQRHCFVSKSRLMSAYGKETSDRRDVDTIRSDFNGDPYRTVGEQTGSIVICCGLGK